MGTALELFQVLSEFVKKPSSGKSPQDSLIDYCRNMLGGIERVHFDFKRKASPSSSTLDEPDKKNLAKAISGFANESGGVLIWGVDDKTTAPSPIADVSQFVDSILQLSHQVTSPSVSGIDGTYIPANLNAQSGFGVIYIPESELPPHRVILDLPQVKDHYFRRSGSSFSRASHSQLEDMFGRRPRPVLDLKLLRDLKCSNDELVIVASLENKGRGIARYPYISLRVHGPFGISVWGVDGNGKIGLPAIEKGDKVGSIYDRYHASMSFGSSDGFAIHPGMVHAVTKIMLFSDWKSSGSSRDLKIDYTIAAEGCPMQTSERELRESDFARLETYHSAN
jgi:hypothetical protein